MDKICAYCKEHAWSDHLRYHVCLRPEQDGEKKCSDSCPMWRESLTGKYDHTEFSKDRVTREEYHELIEMTNEEDNI